MPRDRTPLAFTFFHVERERDEGFKDLGTSDHHLEPDHGPDILTTTTMMIMIFFDLSLVVTHNTIFPTEVCSSKFSRL